MKVFAFLGYSGGMKPELKKYLDEGAELANREKPQAILPVGARTQMSALFSEAHMMAEYLLPKLDYGVQYYLLENSYTTLENIQEIARAIRQLKFENVELTIFCEWNRRHKVAVLAYLVMPELRGSVRIHPVRWEIGWLPVAKQAVSLVCEVGALWIPAAADLFRQMRLRKAQRT